METVDSTKGCKFCSANKTKLVDSNQDLEIWNEIHSPSGVDQNLSETLNSTLHLVTEDIFALFCSPQQSHESQLQDVFVSLSRLKSDKINKKILFLSISDICVEIPKLFDKSHHMELNFQLPPTLSFCVQFCETVFDWLAEGDQRCVLVFSNKSLEHIVLMIYCFSRFYDSLTRRDMNKSCTIKTFINSNTAYLQKTPVSFRRYAGYMSLYSCMNQLKSPSTSVHLYCLILYSFPNLEPNPLTTSHLFFKVYTGNPLRCAHTTRTYTLASNINRLVILFDQFPISLYNDVMIICYHKYPVLGRRKLFRLNFHCCQATNDLLTFLRPDFENIYDGCPLRMKLDMYFRPTAVFEDDHFQCFNELKSSSSQPLSPVQKFDSYGDFHSAKFEQQCRLATEPEEDVLETSPSDTVTTETTLSSPVTGGNLTSASVAISIVKTQLADYRVPADGKVINQSGQITGPVDTYHSTKLDSVRTSTTQLNNSNSALQQHNQQSGFMDSSGTGHQDRSWNDANKCNRQLEHLIQDLSTGYKHRNNEASGNNDKYRFGSLTNVNGQSASTHFKPRLPSVSGASFSTTNSTTAASAAQKTATNSGTNQRETLLMSELLEAQREISNLRRSINHLDRAPPTQGQNSGFSQKTNQYSTNMNSRTGRMDQGGGSFRGATLSPRMSTKFGSPRSPNPGVAMTTGIQGSNNFSHTLESTSNFGTTNPMNTYSAHRENQAERDRIMRQNQEMPSRNQTNQSQHLHETAASDTTEVVEELETINLQPIGKGIQDLNVGTGAANTSLRSGTSHAQNGANDGFLARSRTPTSTAAMATRYNDLPVINAATMSPPMARQNFSWIKNTETGSNHNNSLSRIDACSPISTMPPLNIHSSGNYVNHQTAVEPGPGFITLQTVEERMPMWYQRSLDRDEAIGILKHSKPGSFIVRDSNTYAGAYGLAVKVATIPLNVVPRSDDLEAEKVRHYLLEQSENGGICFKGFPEEPSFSSLCQLVYHYSRTATVLPCTLLLPVATVVNKSPMTLHKTISNTSAAPATTASSTINLQSNGNSIHPKLGYPVYYLGMFDVEYITGPSVLNRAVERLLSDLDPRRFSECQLLISAPPAPNDGILLTDTERKVFFRRHHPFSSISYCGVDPRDRKLELDLCKSRGVKKAKVFGLVVSSYVNGQSKCFLFSDLHPNFKSVSIVADINGHLQQHPR